MRHEIKYIVPKGYLDTLKSMISPFVNVDKNARDRADQSYTVRSIYFDTPDLLFYREKIEGIPYRMKLRVRGYGLESENAPVFLEIKRKHMVPMTKNRAPLPFEMVKDILAGNVSSEVALPHLKPLQEEDFSRFLYQLHFGNLSPTVLVVYDREPYEAKHDPTVRITLDKNLRSRAIPIMDELFIDDLSAVMTEHFILEVKYDHYYPQWMLSIVNALNIKQISASKYCMSIDNHPALLTMGPWQFMQSRPDAQPYV